MKFVLTISLIGLLAGSGAALAEEHAMDHSAMSGTTMQEHHGTGKVNRVDMQNGTVNLTHGPIKSLGWMGMTMDFRVKDKSILQGIRAGQQVDFEVVKEAPGKFYIIRVSPSK